ncbi:MAG: hypothetical protein ACTSPG_05120 [Candidatus Hodarchaeales archaeon]
MIELNYIDKYELFKKGGKVVSQRFERILDSGVREVLHEYFHSPDKRPAMIYDPDKIMEELKPLIASCVPPLRARDIEFFFDFFFTICDVLILTLQYYAIKPLSLPYYVTKFFIGRFPDLIEQHYCSGLFSYYPLKVPNVRKVSRLHDPQPFIQYFNNIDNVQRHPTVHFVDLYLHYDVLSYMTPVAVFKNREDTPTAFFGTLFSYTTDLCVFFEITALFPEQQVLFHMPAEEDFIREFLWVYYLLQYQKLRYWDAVCEVVPPVCLLDSQPPFKKYPKPYDGLWRHFQDQHFLYDDLLDFRPLLDKVFGEELSYCAAYYGDCHAIRQHLGATDIPEHVLKRSLCKQHFIDFFLFYLHCFPFKRECSYPGPRLGSSKVPRTHFVEKCYIDHTDVHYFLFHLFLYGYLDLYEGCIVTPPPPYD